MAEHILHSAFDTLFPSLLFILGAMYVFNLCVHL
jgi:hypothetical protein